MVSCVRSIGRNSSSETRASAKMPTRTRSRNPPESQAESFSTRTGDFGQCFSIRRYCFQGMNLDDPRIRVGNAIVQAVLRKIDVELRARGVRFLVVLFPTKQMVYRPLMQKQQANVPDSYFRLPKHEQRLTADIERFLTDSAIEFVNLTAALRACFERGVRPFPPSDNTHPNADGYEAAAAAVAARLGSR